MKKMVFLLLVLLLISTTGEQNVSAERMVSDFRGVWVSSVFNLDFPSKKNLTVAEMKNEINRIVAQTAEIGLNAVILQVRPSGDALYKSEIFPWSEYLTGTQGAAPPDGFDPLSYWIEQSHAHGLELHAWINPYRITTTGSKITNVNQLSATNPARRNPSLAVNYNNAFYFDPGLPENRKLIIDGIVEIVENYDIDGIHLDDYFYPGTDFADNTTYAKYGNGKNKDDWRRENVNNVIEGIYKAVKELDPNVRVGVSPFAIWQNSDSTPLGSDTRGFESYKSIYSDSRKWVLEGWLDYVCPQIYWYIGYGSADYQKVLDWWSDLCEGTNVDLYVGHAAYKEAESQNGWQGEIIRQLKMNEMSKAVKGSIFFRNSHLGGNLGVQIKNYYAGTGNVMPTAMDALSVAQPSSDISVTGASGYMIFGTCDPSKELYMNDTKITNITSEGFFSAYVNLDKGENIFTFSQAGQASVSRTITLKDTVAAQLDTMSTPNITNPFPSVDEFLSAGDTVTLRCTAPVGAVVTATVNGETFTLSDNNLNMIYPNDSLIYSTTYSYRYTIAEGQPSVISDLGTVRYSMTYNDNTYSTTSFGHLKNIGKDTPYYATVTSEAAWLYAQASSSGGSAWQLLKGQKDRVTAVSGDNWVRLSTGRWIGRQEVTLTLEESLQTNVLSDGIYFSSENTDALIWQTSVYPAIDVVYDGQNMTVYFGMHTELPEINFSEETDSIFSDIKTGNLNGTPYYIFTIKDSVNMEGYYVDFSDGEFRLNFKKRKSLNTNGLPLSGFEFVIDAGHGLTDTGAQGPLGLTLTEKDLNLVNSLKLSERLKKLGASVTMVRTTDVFYTLQERTEISRVANPDMFISIHANSLAETTDSTNVQGLTVWYRNANSVPLAEKLIEHLYKINPMTTRHQVINQSNFYVCRPAWTPSVIIETSFMNNINDYSWLIKSANQDALAEATVNSILDYYSAE